ACIASQAATLPSDRHGGSDVILVTILVAKKDVPRATLLTKPSDYFELERVPLGKLPSRSYHSFDDVKDQMVVNPVAKDECITARHLFEPGKGMFPEELAPGQIPF